MQTHRHTETHTCMCVYKRSIVGGVLHRLGVLDHRERNDAVVAVENLLELVEADPEVVGVEVLVLVGVLKVLLVLLRALRRLPVCM